MTLDELLEIREREQEELKKYAHRVNVSVAAGCLSLHSDQVLNVLRNEVVKQGKELLSECSEEEADRLDTAAGLQLNSRLGCQAIIEKPGEVVVEIPSWNRNYICEGGASTL